MEIFLPIFLICCNFRSLTAVSDHVILYEDSGLLMNDTTGVTTIDQRAKSILYGTTPTLSGCTVNDECCKCTKEQCNSEKIIKDFTVALTKISKSTASRLSKVATTLNALIVDSIAIFKKSDEPTSRDELAKNISKTFERFEIILSNQTEVIGVVSAEIIKMLQIIQSDLLKITQAMSVKDKNAAACDLGNHIMIIMDCTAEITKMTFSVSTLVTDELSQGILSLELVTSIILVLVEETLARSIVQVNKVGFKNDTSSSILLHVSLAVKEYIVVIQHISQCPDAESIMEILPTVTTSLCTLRTKLSVSISSTTGYVKKYPVPPVVTGIIDCILDCVRNSKHLKDTETAISETIFSLFDICNTILAARLSCSSIEGFVGNVDILIRNVLLYVHTIFVLLANIDDDIFSCGNNLVMFLTMMNVVVVKVMHSIDEVIHSILSLGEITEGGTSLINVFEAVVDVSSSVIQCVAYIFSELKYGSHLVDLPKAIPGIMLDIKSRIDVARNRLNEKLTVRSISKSDHSNIYKEASTIISSYMEFKHNIVDVVCSIDSSEGNDEVDDIRSSKVDIFIGKVKSAAARLSSDGVGSDIAAKLNEICDEAYDVLILLSTFCLVKWEVLKIISYVISNFYFGFVSLSSIINCSQGGTNVSVF